MAINLLPNEEKAKIKSTKQPTSSQIQYSKPIEEGKKGKGTGKAGVLTFIKRSFQRPQEKKKDEEVDKILRFPGKKVDVFKEEVKYKKATPKMEFSKPHKVKKEESLRVKPSIGIGQKIADWFRKLFAPKPKAYKAEVAPKEEVHDEKPQYRSVKISSVNEKVDYKPRKEEVIKVFTREEKKPIEESAKEKELPVQVSEKKDEFIFEKEPIIKAEKKDEVLSEKAEVKTNFIVKEKGSKKLLLEGPTFWERIFDKFRRLFSRKKKAKKTVSLLTPAEEIIKNEEQKKMTDEAIQQKEEQIIREVEEKPIPNFKPGFNHKFSSVVPFKPVNSKSENKDIPKIDFKDKLLESFPPINREIPKPPPIKKPIQEDIKFEKPTQEKKEKLPVPLPPTKEKEDKKPKDKKENWLTKLINKFKSLFSRKRNKDKFVLPKKEEPIREKHKENEAARDDKKFKIPPPLPIKKAAVEPIGEAGLGAKNQKPTVSPPPPPSTEKKTDPKKNIVEFEKKDKGSRFTQPEVPAATSVMSSFDVNLVPEEMIEKKVPKSKLIIMGAVLVVSIFFIIGVRFGLEIYYQNIIVKIEEINQEISVLDTDIRSYDELQKNVKNMKNKIDNVRDLLNSHIYWSQFLSKLESYTIPDVYYTGLTADVNGAVSLTVVGRDYESAVKQYLVFQNAKDFVSTVSISAIQLVSTEKEEESEVVEDVVKFVISLKVIPQIFSFQK